METSAKIAIIGAGIVGCAVAEHLVTLGCNDVVVVDQGPLFATGGSTSHAPGLVFQTTPSKTMTELARYTVEHFSELRRDGESCFKPVGSIEVARTPERLSFLRFRHGLASSWGVSSRLIKPHEVAELIPVLDPGVILGGLHVPSDGIAKALWAAEAMAARATAKGARFKGGVTVTGIDVRRGRVVAVETSEGRIAADVVVSCAGMWGPIIGRMAGVSIPLMPVQHQLVWTRRMPELAGETDEIRHPILRDQDRAMYFRQRGEGYGVGSYQHEPLPVSPDDIPAPGDAPRMPSLMEFTDDDFKQAWYDAQELLPPLRTAEMGDCINGLFSFTPDGMPLIGEARSARGFWAAEAVWITHSAGVGKATAEWIVNGAPTIDLRECDLHRFERHAYSSSYVRARACRQYDEVYDIIHPMQPMEEPRPLRVSPFYPRQRGLSAFFLEANGWERPHWYESNSRRVEWLQFPRPDEWAGRYWSPTVAAEHVATRSRVAMFDMTPLKRAEITGPGSLGFLQRLTTNQLDRPPGYVTYTLMLDDRAGIKSDITVARLDQDRFQVGLNGPRDIVWLEQNLPEDGSVVVRDVTGGTCCIGLWGPRARDVVQQLSDDDFSNDGFGFFRAREAFIREIPVVALRLSYVGELGWELYTSAEHGLRLWDLLWSAGRDFGVVAGGRGAFNGLRLEKGYRAWGQDMWSEHDPYEAGLAFAVNLDKGAFVGRDALSRRRDEGPRRRLCCLTVEDGTWLLGKEPVFSGRAPVGFVTSAAYGHSVDKSIAYAWLPPELAAETTHVEVEFLGGRHTATVSPDPLFDPEMKRMRS